MIVVRALRLLDRQFADLQWNEAAQHVLPATGASLVKFYLGFGTRHGDRWSVDAMGARHVSRQQSP